LRHHRLQSQNLLLRRHLHQNQPQRSLRSHPSQNKQLAKTKMTTTMMMISP
jgi:hypothetical protein